METLIISLLVIVLFCLNIITIYNEDQIFVHQRSLKTIASQWEEFLERRAQLSLFLDSRVASPPSSSSQQPIRRRTFSFEQPTCSSEFQAWVAEYVQWHATHRLEGPYLISKYDLTMGMSDRVVDQISTFAVAIMSHRVFLVQDPWPRELERIVFPSINMTIPENINMSNTLFRDERNVMLRMPWDYNQDQHYHVVEQLSNRGHLARLFAFNSPPVVFNLTLETVFGCLHSHLYTLRVDSLDRPEYSQALQTFLNPDLRIMGVQIRTGAADDHTDDSKATMLQKYPVNAIYQTYLNCIATRPKVDRLFLVSDTHILVSDASETIRHHMEADSNITARSFHTNGVHLLGHTVYIQNNVTLQETRLRHAWVEQFLFSQSDEFLITWRSGYGRLGAYASQRKSDMPLYTVNQYQNMARVRSEYDCEASKGHHYPLDVAVTEYAGM